MKTETIVFLILEGLILIAIAYDFFREIRYGDHDQYGDKGRFQFSTDSLGYFTLGCLVFIIWGGIYLW